MQYTANIYGTANSTTPDMRYTFSVGEQMKDGAWTFSVSNPKYEMYSELIGELTENTVAEAVRTKIDEILNNLKKDQSIANLSFRLYYDDETKVPVVKEL